MCKHDLGEQKRARTLKKCDLLWISEWVAIPRLHSPLLRYLHSRARKNRPPASSSHLETKTPPNMRGSLVRFPWGCLPGQKTRNYLYGDVKSSGFLSYMAMALGLFRPVLPSSLACPLLELQLRIKGTNRISLREDFSARTVKGAWNSKHTS